MPRFFSREETIIDKLFRVISFLIVAAGLALAGALTAAQAAHCKRKYKNDPGCSSGGDGGSNGVIFSATAILATGTLISGITLLPGLLGADPPTPPCLIATGEFDAQAGASNQITTCKVLEALGLVVEGRIVPLSRVYEAGMPLFGLAQDGGGGANEVADLRNETEAPSLPQSAIDDGVTPNLWQMMTPEERALWQN